MSGCFLQKIITTSCNYSCKTQDLLLSNSVDVEHAQARSHKWKIIYDGESISKSIFKKKHCCIILPADTCFWYISHLPGL